MNDDLIARKLLRLTEAKEVTWSRLNDDERLSMLFVNTYRCIETAFTYQAEYNGGVFYFFTFYGASTYFLAVKADGHPTKKLLLVQNHELLESLYQLIEPPKNDVIDNYLSDFLKD